ncbi:MAG: TonB family protein, partial [Deltaproteobacteria bacterium]|nr:TonB family protein [Deltaproteobacteria bacterium]
MRVIAARLIVAPLLVTVMLGGRPVHADDAPPPLSKPPRLKRFVPASAPAELATRRQVEVVLVIDVNVAGAVDRVEVVGSGGPEFDAAAVGAARGFAFEPGEAGGKPVPVRVTYRYRFFLTPASQPASRPARQAATGPSWRTIVRVPGFATVPVRGRVLKRGEGGVPLVGVRVYLDDGAQVASTDAKGRFGFAAVPAGGHTLKVRGSEVAPTDAAITARAGKELQVTIFVAALEPYTSVVRGRRVVPEVVEQNLQIEEIKRIPGTQGDTLKAVQNLAGVARAPFILGFLVVWGSSPGDTRVYLDDVRIPALYHLGALRSTVNSESIQSLTFLPGGYGAAHGRGLGGVIQVQTRPPRTDGLHGFVQLDLMDGAIGIEGPLTRNLAVGASVRRSWIDVFLPLFTTSDFQLSPKYYDYQARLRWQASPRDIIDATVFGSDDSMTLKLKRPDPT